MTNVTDADREAAADMWRDYVAKPGECIVERQMRSGEMDDFSSLIHAFSHHRTTAEKSGYDRAIAEVERLRAELQQINVDAIEHYDEWCFRGVKEGEAIEFADQLHRTTSAALEQQP